MSDSLIPSFLMSDVSKLLRLLTKNERSEQITQVAQQKWATMSDLLRLLTKNERMRKLLIFWANHSFAHIFAQQIDEQIPNPGAAWQNLSIA